MWLIYEAQRYQRRNRSESVIIRSFSSSWSSCSIVSLRKGRDSYHDGPRWSSPPRYGDTPERGCGIGLHNTRSRLARLLVSA
jgi:hypothetical protein